MKLFTTLLKIGLFLILTSASCKNKDVNTNNYAKCYEQPPTATTCMAFWENWIYDADGDSCKFVGYSGCEPVGFDTKQECEKCRE